MAITKRDPAAEAAADLDQSGRVTAADRAARLTAAGLSARLAAAGLPARLALAATAGLLLAISFPPYGWWLLALPAVAALSLLTRGVSAGAGALIGLVYGLAFFAVLMRWMTVIGPDAWILLSLLEAAFMAALGAALAVTARLPGWPLVHAALWVGVELLRARIPWGGMPWGRLAFGQAGTPLTPYAALGGAPLVTFVTAAIGAGLAYLVVAGLAGRRRRLGGAIAVISIVTAVGAAALVPTPTAGERTVTVALVQGNVPRLGLDFLGQREAVLRNHIALTDELTRRVAAGELPQPDLVIWPENASDIDPYRDPAARALIDDAVRWVGVPTLVGAVINSPDPDELYNVGIVWDPRTGPGARYVKRHPVPFGEYVPFRDVLERYITRFDRVRRDFVGGDRPGVLEVGPARVADVICFEIAYDGLVRDVIRGGGQVLVVQTNNATYGRTGQTEQQLAMSRLRAIEHGRPVLIAATSGISAVIAADGTIVEQSAEFRPELLVQPVALRSVQTPATRVGAIPEWLLALAGLAAVGFAVWTGGRLSRQARSEGPAGTGGSAGSGGSVGSGGSAGSGGSVGPGGSADSRDTVDSPPTSAQTGKAARDR
ncbi:MAG TPA: apolipoprotein N-acyltransferase [Actinomycetes bacterium]|nr:apolipoprotein N-acyltransferase [Actinomycetes bacterium]